MEGGCLNVSELDRRPKQKEVEREEWGGGSVLMFQDQKVRGLDKRPHQQDEGREKWGEGVKMYQDCTGFV